MRQKYRAYDKKKNKYIDIIGFYYYGDHIVLWFLDNEGIPNYKNYHVKGIILEQYIDKKDKNGKEIFEGDKLQPDWGNEREGILIYDSNYAQYIIRSESKEYDFVCTQSDEYEITGTIHDKEADSGK